MTSARVSEPALPLFLAALRVRQGQACCASFPMTRTPATPPRQQPGSPTELDRIHAEPRCRARLGPPAASAPRRRACTSARRALPRRARLCLRGWPCRAAATAGAAPRSGDDLAGEGAAGLDELVEQIVPAGYERVERVEERGQIAVRGGILDVFPTTGPRPGPRRAFRGRGRGIRAFSPYTQRALRTLDAVTVFPAAEATDEDDDGDRVPALARQPTSSGGPMPLSSAGVNSGSIAIQPARRSIPCPPVRITSSRPSARRSPRAGSPRLSASSAASSATGYESSSRFRTAVTPSEHRSSCAASRRVSSRHPRACRTTASCCSSRLRRGRVSSGARSASR